jgi:DNA polymerase-3 subunit epsilon
LNFVAIDVETANAKLSSICQVGIATFQNGILVDSWVSLINPEDDFDRTNVAIHGINAARVRNAPIWRTVLPQITARLSERIVVSHTPFDRVAIAQACELIGEPLCACVWLDSARVVRRAWSRFARAGYGLTNIARHFEISYQAHDALEDAKCAGLVVLRAVAETGISIEEWLIRVEKPIRHDGTEGFTKLSANPDGELYGEVVVFTGNLSIPRSEAAAVAAAAGCCVEAGVTKKTTMLVVGDQDLSKLNGKTKSSKHLKVEELISSGQPIRILPESDFMRMAAVRTQNAYAAKGH